MKSEQRAETADIGMRVVAFCGRGDLQIALCWCEQWSVLGLKVLKKNKTIKIHSILIIK